jgi:hypothetical protein
MTTCHVNHWHFARHFRNQMIKRGTYGVLTDAAFLLVGYHPQRSMDRQAEFTLRPRMAEVYQIF